MDNSIIADTENIDKVVTNFSAELSDYIYSMEDQLAAMTESLVALGEGWESDDYEKFKDTMQIKIRKIQSEIEGGKELKEYLLQKSEELHELLKILKEAAEL